MKRTFNSFNEHILIPVTLISGTALVLGLFYLGDEYLSVYTKSETFRFYIYNEIQSRQAYLNTKMAQMLACVLLLLLSALSVIWKKRWIFLLVIMANLSLLGFLIFF